MTTRVLATSLRLCRQCHIRQNGIRIVSPKRRYSSSTASPPGHVESSSPASKLAIISNDLDKISSRIDVSAESIEILQSPAQFYETLKSKIKTAKDRLFFSTLYIGKSEHDFIETIRGALKTTPTLKVSFLTDALRGTREAPDPSCASLLASLVDEFGADRVEVRVYHTPNLTGRKKAMIPKRINEGWGLQHMKLYGFDDEIVMSGANLSNDYFTNRQDRYHLFNSKVVTDHFHKLYRAVCDLSYSVIPCQDEPSGFILDWPANNIQPAPVEDPQAFIQAATRKLKPFTELTNAATDKSNSDTFVYPLVQLTPLLRPDTSTELPAMTSILRALSTKPLIGSSWTFTAGYFNMTPNVQTLLLNTQPTKATVVAASPWANGFYGSKGVSGMLPAAYTFLSRRFLNAVSAANLSQQITLKEWRRGTVNTPAGWTYHAKGLWVTLPGERNPSLSLIGSSNYTKRSYSLDLEANVLIVTQNEDLKRRLGEEERWLQEYARPVDRDEFAKPERRVGLHVRIAMWIVTLVGGAL